MITATVLVGLTLGCGNWSNLTSTSNANNLSDNSNIASANAPKKAAPSDCPTSALSVTEFKSSGKNYEGCLVSVTGKLWEVQSATAALIEQNERTDYNGVLYIGVNFSDNRYFDIQSKISKMKIDQQYDRLPVVTFSGSGETNSGYTGLKNAVLTDSRGY